MSFLPVNDKNRWPYFFLTAVYVMGVYMLTNHYGIVQPVYLPMTPLDTMTPFLPWTGYIYVIIFFFPLLAGFFIRGDREVKGIISVYLIAATFNNLIYLFFPTAYPRITLEEPTFANFALYFIQHLDSPNNCLPSGHVCYAFISAFVFIRYDRRWGQFSLLLAIVVSLSTLTTKQHYMWDVVTGYIVARVVYKAVEVFYLGPPKEVPYGVSEEQAV